MLFSSTSVNSVAQECYGNINCKNNYKPKPKKTRPGTLPDRPIVNPVLIHNPRHDNLVPAAL